MTWRQGSIVSSWRKAERRFCRGDPVPALLNFAVIVEVLSDSTHSYDRGEKFARCRSTPTLREYLVIDPERVYIELHTRRDDGAWLLREITDLSATITLQAIPAALPLAEIYLNVF